MRKILIASYLSTLFQYQNQCLRAGQQQRQQQMEDKLKMILISYGLLGISLAELRITMVRVFCVPEKIQIDHHPNTNLRHYLSTQKCSVGKAVDAEED
jgi:hypothetical protein